MFDDREKEDLKKLIQTGKRHGGRLSSMFLSNFFVGFPSEKQTEDNYNEMIDYWNQYLEDNGLKLLTMAPG